MASSRDAAAVGLGTTSTPSASGAPAPLLKCASTPIVPTFFDLGHLLEGAEAHLTFR